MLLLGVFPAVDDGKGGIVPLPSRALATRREDSLLARGADTTRELSRTKTRARIIIVQDEAKILAFLQRGLAARGYEVLGVAMDGGEAVRLFRNTRPDVVIMNGLMPGLDGIEASRRILAEDQRTSVLLQSAWFSGSELPDRREQERIQRSRIAGISACLATPFALDHVVEKVDHLAAMPTAAPLDWCWIPPTVLPAPDDPRRPYSSGPLPPRPAGEDATVSGFLISRTPVTNAQLHLFVKQGGYGHARFWAEAQEAGMWDQEYGYWARPAPLGLDSVDFSRSNAPATRVSMFQAKAFALWAHEQLLSSRQEVVCGTEVAELRTLLTEHAWKVDLPSEAEWHSAALQCRQYLPSPDPSRSSAASADDCPLFASDATEWTRSRLPTIVPEHSARRQALYYALAADTAQPSGLHVYFGVNPAAYSSHRFRLAIVPPVR